MGNSTIRDILVLLHVIHKLLNIEHVSVFALVASSSRMYIGQEIATVKLANGIKTYRCHCLFLKNLGLTRVQTSSSYH